MSALDVAGGFYAAVAGKRWFRLVLLAPLAVAFLLSFWIERMSLGAGKKSILGAPTLYLNFLNPFSDVDAAYGQSAPMSARRAPKSNVL
jgi:FtsH-binding integral membrane protein